MPLKPDSLPSTLVVKIRLESDDIGPDGPIVVCPLCLKHIPMSMKPDENDPPICPGCGVGLDVMGPRGPLTRPWKILDTPTAVYIAQLFSSRLTQITRFPSSQISARWHNLEAAVNADGGPGVVAIQIAADALHEKRPELGRLCFVTVLNTFSIKGVGSRSALPALEDAKASREEVDF